MIPIGYNEILEIARGCGLRILAIVDDLSPLREAEKTLCEWQESGCAGEMHYMLRPPAALDELLPGVRTVLICAAALSGGAGGTLPGGCGRVARYAWGRDYHRVLKHRLRLAAEQLKAAHEGLAYRVFTDAVPLLERALARRAGVGFIGKNTMLIRPGAGSFLLLGELLLAAEVAGAPAPAMRERCGDCTLCLDGCPAAALTRPRRLDARRCISYLTIEKRGALTVPERESIGEWIFGCDLCQECCPYNARALHTAAAVEIPELDRAAGCGPFLELQQVLRLRDGAAFTRRFAGTPLMRATREGLLRNAAVVAANICALEAVPALSAAAAEDAAPLVRAHALWALGRLAPHCSAAERRGIRVLVERGQKEKNEAVAKEAQALLESEE